MVVAKKLKTSNTKTGAEIVWESIEAEGVKTVFGYPGGVVLPFYDALPKFPQIRHILVRNEQGAALAADGYGRITGKPGVCISTSGPGATNLITGIANAFMDSVPMVAITGQVSTSMIGSDAFQEVDTTGLTLPITKHNYLVDNIKDLGRVIREAFYLSNTGRPGPVHIDIPVDIFKDSTKFKYSKDVKISGFTPEAEADPNQISKAIDLINSADRPVILAGHGVLISKAWDELKYLAEKADIPVITTLLGMSGFPEEHKLCMGMLGMHGQAHANFAVHNSDLILGIGMRFDDRITGKIDEFAENAKVIHIEVDPAEVGKNTIVDVPIIGNCKTILQKINKKLEKNQRADWLEKISEWRNKFRKITCDVPKNSKMQACHVIDEIFNVTKGKAIISSDVGQNQMWTAQYYKFNYPNKLLSSGGLGAMGYSLPAAIGAKMASPSETVWAIMGDGGFQMNSQELMTLIQDKINIKIAILNNTYLGMVRQWQELFYDKKYVATPLMNPDFIKLAESYGVKAMRAKNTNECAECTSRAMKEKGPVLVEYIIDPEDNVFPMVTPGNPLTETGIKK